MRGFPVGKARYCFLILFRGSLGNSLRKRTKYAVTLLPAIISVTAKMIMMMPQQRRGVSASPKIVTPKKMAVSGSKAPRMAVGVEPIY